MIFSSFVKFSFQYLKGHLSENDLNDYIYELDGVFNLSIIQYHIEPIQTNSMRSRGRILQKKKLWSKGKNSYGLERIYKEYFPLLPLNHFI